MNYKIMRSAYFSHFEKDSVTDVGEHPLKITFLKVFEQYL